MMNISKETILTERLHRHRLLQPVTTEEEYAELFRLLQPVAGVADSCPGTPPVLVHRATFDDSELTDLWRADRRIVKGRFLNGGLGYVFSNELELYGNAFQRPLIKLSLRQELIYETLAHVGPLTPRQIKEETGLLNKEIMPILHRLQQAFLVYEDQVDSSWERSWYIFSSEWPEVEINPERWGSAAQEVLRRFIHAQVFVTEEQIKDWSGWSIKQISHVLRPLKTHGDIGPCTIEGFGTGWMQCNDININASSPPRAVIMLHRSDPLVHARASELKRRFAGLEVLQYLLIDGDFRGAVCGHWRINPFDVDDIIIELDASECAKRKAEIIDAVAWGYHPPHHHILHYMGKHLKAL
jgi:hypothetical protein